MDIIQEFANRLGYDKVVKITDWNGYEVYQARHEGDTIKYEGFPRYVLKEGNNIREADFTETWTIMGLAND